MNSPLDAHGIAERVRRLLPESDFGGLADTAHRLGVKELALRVAIDRRAPHQTLEMLAAIVNVYGVDPCWLLYGDYNCATHRRALEQGVTRDTLLDVARRAEPPRLDA